MATIAIEQPNEADLEIIHSVLRDTYWSPGIPRTLVEELSEVLMRSRGE